jgi:hypothetical protein
MAIVPDDVIRMNVMIAIRISGIGSPPNDKANTSLGIGPEDECVAEQEDPHHRLAPGHAEYLLVPGEIVDDALAAARFHYRF